MPIPDPHKLVLALVLALGACPMPALGQAMMSECAIYKVYSENARFYLTSVPFDNQVPSLRGKTAVYEVGRPAPLYTLDRPFHESFGGDSVFLSNDGRVILAVLGWEPQENVPGLKSITVYKDGKLARDFTAAEVTGVIREKSDAISSIPTTTRWSTVEEFASDDKYRLHRVFVTGVLTRDGKFTPDELDVRGSIDRGKVEQFFAEERFDTSVIPAPCDSWYLRIHSFAFRNPDDRAARRERQAEIREEKRDFERRLKLDAINGVYIPRDLGDCLLELDKRLADVDKAEMRAKANRDDMIDYHMGLGMWLRNNWGLWGGSRLQKYFTDRGVKHPDDMSGVILWYYWDWLHGDKDDWRTWEKTWRSRTPRSPPPPSPGKSKKKK